MKLNDWTLPSELDKALKEHEIKENYSSFKLICELLEDYLYDKGYYRIEVSDNLYLEIEQKSNDSVNDGFKEIKQNGNIRLYHGDLDFSSYKPELIDEVKSRLLSSNKKLEDLAKNNFEGTVHEYKQRLLFELGIHIPKNSKSHLLTNIYHDNQKKMYYIRKHLKVNGKSSSPSFVNTSSEKEAIKLRDFLRSKNWDLKYTPKNTGLHGANQLEFLLNEMRKEESEINGNNTTE